MVTPIREFEIGGVYHIVNRGIDKRKIFLKSQDYSRFILGLYYFNDTEDSDIWDKVFGQKKEPLGFLQKVMVAAEERDSRNRIVDLLCFVFMPNHIHLVIQEIQDGGISLFMNKIGGYTKYFNKQYDRTGHLFEGRYKMVPIKNETQLGNVFNYVHTNPVALKESAWKDFKVKNARNAINWLSTYRWSSYHDYVGNAMFPGVIQQDFFLEFFGDKEACRQSVDDWIKFKAKNTAVGEAALE